MRLFKKIPVRVEESEYEIRILYDDVTINVVAFLGNRPANGYRHQVKLPKSCNVEELLTEYSFDELVGISKSEIAERRWDRLASAIQKASSTRK